MDTTNSEQTSKDDVQEWAEGHRIWTGSGLSHLAIRGFVADLMRRTLEAHWEDERRAFARRFYGSGDATVPDLDYDTYNTGA